MLISSRVVRSTDWPELGLLMSSLLLVACATGTADPNTLGQTADSTASSDEKDDERIPKSVNLEADSSGNYGPDRVGLVGGWSSEAGPGSEIDLDFDDGNVCLQGTTATVENEDHATYWGARARVNLCEDDDGNALPVSECLSQQALDDFVGVSFSLIGDALPWLVSLQFIEADREVPTSMWLTSEGETLALFSQATNPFDSSAPPIDVSGLEAIVVRAVGTPDGSKTFDFCIESLKALFGDDWATVATPDWLDEPGPGQQVDFVGANLVGAEFGEQNLPGEYGSDYIYPSADEVNLYADKGMNIFRIPFRWERMQRSLYDDLHPTELGYLKDSVAAARERNATTIIDPHNFARYEDDPNDDVAAKVIGVDIEIEAFADFWAKLAREFVNDDLVWFGLMNEPHDMETETWVAAANAAIAAIRAEGAENKILVPGNQWTGAHAWFESYYGTPNSEALQDIVDSDHNVVFELHQYFDADYSGTSNSCVSETVGVERVEPVTTWLRDQGYRGFLGEFGGSDDPVCLGAMDNLLAHLGDNSDVWLGWSVWAATEWGIRHNVRPVNGNDVPQMRVLLRHMGER